MHGSKNVCEVQDSQAWKHSEISITLVELSHGIEFKGYMLLILWLLSNDKRTVKCMQIPGGSKWNVNNRIMSRTWKRFQNPVVETHLLVSTQVSADLEDVVEVSSPLFSLIFTRSVLQNYGYSTVNGYVFWFVLFTLTANYWLNSNWVSRFPVTQNRTYYILGTVGQTLYIFRNPPPPPWLIYLYSKWNVNCL